MENPHQKIIEFLESNGIEYKETVHEPVFTSEQAAKIRGVSLSTGAKALLLKLESGFVLALLPGDRRLDSKKLKKIIGTKNISFASPEQVEETMGCKIGACYPFGHVANLRTYADFALSKNEIINFNAGLHDHSIEMKWADFYRVEKPVMADFSKEAVETNS